MKLNCKPGDLAVIVSPRSGHPCYLTGRFCTVLKLAQNNRVKMPDDHRVYELKGSVGACWLIQYSYPIAIISDLGQVAFSTYDLLWNSRLRPIRDPGPDAVDETLLWLPVPTNEGVAA